MGSQARLSRRQIPGADWQIELAGSGLGRPMVFSYEDLARMPMSRLDNVVQRMTHFPDRRTSWRGPSLDLLFAAAELENGPMKITLEASDGYRIDCKRDDLRSAIVALQDGDGRWLVEVGKRHVLKLVPPHATGDLWVVNLRRIVVEPTGDAESQE